MASVWSLTSVAVKLFLLALTIMPLAQAADRVAVQVSGYDPALIDRVTSYLTREMRSLRAIKIVDTAPSQYLRIMVVENKGKGDSVGYTLSVLVSSTVQEDYLRTSVPDEARRAFLLKFYGNAEKLADYWIVSAPPKGLEEACAKIVATFNMDRLRQTRQTLGEALYAAPPHNP